MKLLRVAVVLPLAAMSTLVPSRSVTDPLPRTSIRAEDSSKREMATGRVKRVDRRRAEVLIETAGHNEVYGVEEARILDALREGDRVQFEYELREDGRKVITRVF